MTDKYTSVDILFHFDVDADNTSDAKAQADVQMFGGAVGTCICNNAKTGQLSSIAKITDDSNITKSKIIQKLAEVSHTCIFDGNSLELAIEKILPAVGLLERANDILKNTTSETELTENIDIFLHDDL